MGKKPKYLLLFHFKIVQSFILYAYTYIYIPILYNICIIFACDCRLNIYLILYVYVTFKDYKIKRLQDYRMYSTKVLLGTAI